MRIDTILSRQLQQIETNLYVDKKTSGTINQDVTTEAFSDKWKNLDRDSDQQKAFLYQRKWYHDLYGFPTDEDLKEFLKDKEVILDAGCGLGYKAAWFAELNPGSLVIGMDFSESVYQASILYKHIPNLVFIQGDIAKTCFSEAVIDFINCDQVIHHTEDPQKTLKHFHRILTKTGIITLYVYARKAVPRELLDDYFRDLCKKVDKRELWQLSEELTELGKRLSALNVKFDCPEIPLLNIKGGEIDIQRFIYWNFIKIFWNEELGYHNSVLTNFDWYSPANAFRYTRKEFEQMITNADLSSVFFREEPACYTVKLKKA